MTFPLVLDDLIAPLEDDEQNCEISTFLSCMFSTSSFKALFSTSTVLGSHFSWMDNRCSIKELDSILEKDRVGLTVLVKLRI